MISSTAQYSLTFPPSLIAAFHFSSFFFHFQSSDLFSHSSVFFFVFFHHTFPHHLCCFNFNPVSSFISFAWFKFLHVITMLFLFLCKFLNFCLFFFLFSSFSFLPLLFLPPPSSLFLHIPVWPFPQFSLSFPGSGVPCSHTLSIPVIHIWSWYIYEIKMHINIFITTSLKWNYCWQLTQSRKIGASQSSFTWRSMEGDCNVYALFTMNALIIRMVYTQALRFWCFLLTRPAGPSASDKHQNAAQVQ